MERDCESELSKLNIEQNACIYHFGASVIHGQRSNILRLHNTGICHISSDSYYFSNKYWFSKTKTEVAIRTLSLISTPVIPVSSDSLFSEHLRSVAFVDSSTSQYLLILNIKIFFCQNNSVCIICILSKNSLHKLLGGYLL